MLSVDGRSVGCVTTSVLTSHSGTFVEQEQSVQPPPHNMAMSDSRQPIRCQSTLLLQRAPVRHNAARTSLITPVGTDACLNTPKGSNSSTGSGNGRQGLAHTPVLLEVRSKALLTAVSCCAASRAALDLALDKRH